MTKPTVAVKAAVGPAVLVLLQVFARIPFDFRAGSTPLDPGEYVIAVDEAAATLAVRSAAGKQVSFTGLHRVGTSGQRTLSTLSFRAYGDTRFLAAIEIENGDRWEIAPSSDEAALERAGGKHKITTLKAIPRGNP